MCYSGLGSPLGPGRCSVVLLYIQRGCGLLFDLGCQVSCRFIPVGSCSLGLCTASLAETDKMSHLLSVIPSTLKITILKVSMVLLVWVGPRGYPFTTQTLPFYYTVWCACCSNRSLSVDSEETTLRLTESAREALLHDPNVLTKDIYPKRFLKAYSLDMHFTMYVYCVYVY